MGRRIDVYDYYANVTWGGGTWTDIYYWGGGYLTVNALYYQSGSVKIFSPNTAFVHLNASISAWEVIIDALPWKSKIDIYGLYRTYVKFNYASSAGGHHIYVSSPGMNEVWSGDGDDRVIVGQGGGYTFIDVGAGADIINLGSGVNTYLYKGNGSLTVSSSVYRSGITQLRAGYIYNLDFKSSSWQVDVSAYSITGYAKVDVYGLEWAKVWLGSSDINQEIRIGAGGTAEVWTGDGSDNITVTHGGRYAHVSAKGGNDAIYLHGGHDIVIKKSWGGLTLRSALHRTGYTYIEAPELGNVDVQSSAGGFTLNVGRTYGSVSIDSFGRDFNRISLNNNNHSHFIKISTWGKNELWTGDGNDGVHVYSGGWYTWLSLGGGWDTVYLSSNSSNTDIQKTWGAINLYSNANHIPGRVSFNSPSVFGLYVNNLVATQVVFDVGRVNGAVNIDVWGSWLVHIKLGITYSNAKIRIGTNAKNEVWTGDGDDSVEVRGGGWYNWLSLAGGSDNIYLSSGTIDTEILKTRGNIVLQSNSIHISGNVSVRGNELNSVKIYNLVCKRFYLDTARVYREIDVDVWGSSLTHINLGHTVTNTKIRVGSSEKNEIWASYGNDNIDIRQAHYTYMNVFDGDDFVQLRTGWHVEIDKGTGSLTVRSSEYRGGNTYIRAGNLKELNVQSSSWGILIDVGDIQNQLQLDVYGLGWMSISVGQNSVGQIITVNSPGNNEVTTGNGDDQVFVMTGGFNTKVDLRNGKDYLYVNNGVNLTVIKGTGQLLIEQNHYLAGRVSLYSQTSKIEYLNGLRSWQAHISIVDSSLPIQPRRETIDVISTPYLSITTLDWTHYDMYTGYHALTVNAYTGYSGTGNVAGHVFLRSVANGYTDLHDYGGKNSYVVGRQGGPLVVWANIHLEREGIAWIAVQGETFKLNNNSKTGGTFLVNNGGVYQAIDLRKGNNGYVDNPYSGYIAERINIGENGYYGNYVLASDTGRHTKYHLGGRNGQVVDFSNSTKTSFISTQYSDLATRNYILLNQARYDFALGKEDFFVANAFFTKNANVAFGIKSTLLLNISKTKVGRVNVDVIESLDKIIAKVGEEVVLSLNKISHISPENIIINILGFGAFTIKSPDSDHPSVPEIGDIISIKYIKNNSRRTEVITYPDSSGGGLSALLGWGLLNLSLLKLNDSHGVSERNIQSAQILFASQASQISNLPDLGMSQGFYLSQNVNGKFFFKTFSVNDISFLDKNAFPFLRLDFYEANNSSDKLSSITKDKAEKVPILTSLDLIVTSEVFASFNPKVQMQLVKNVLGISNVENIVDFVIAFKDLPALYFRNLKKPELLIVKEQLYLGLNPIQQEAVDQAWLQYEQLVLFEKYKQDIYQVSTLATSLYGDWTDVPEVDHWRPILNLGIKPAYNRGAWPYFWATTFGVVPSYTFYNFKVMKLNEVLSGNDFKSIKKFMEDNWPTFSEDIKGTWNRLEKNKEFFDAALKDTLEHVNFLQSFRHHTAFYRGFAGVVSFGASLKAANDRGDYDGIVLSAIKIVHVVAAAFQVPTAYFIDALTKEGAGGKIELNSFHDFVAFYEKRAGVSSLYKWGNKIDGRKVYNFKSNRSLIRDIAKDSGIILGEIDGNESGRRYTFSIQELQEPRSYQRKWLRVSLPVFLYEVTNVGGFGIDLYVFIQTAIATHGVFSNPDSSASDRAAMVAYSFADLFVSIGDIGFAVADFTGVIFLLAEQGVISSLSAIVRYTLESIAYQFGTLFYTLVFISLAIAYLAQITEHNVLMPLLGAFQEIAYGILSVVATLFPETTAPIFAVFILAPNLGSAVMAAVAGDQRNLILNVASKIDADPTMTWDRLSGYIETCQPFKAIYMLANALHIHLSFAAAPIGSVLGPIAQLAVASEVKIKIMQEQDFADSPGVMTHALFNFFKTVAGEQFVFNFITQDVRYLPGGSGVIDWLYYGGDLGFGKKIDDRIKILRKLYQTGVQFILSFKDAGSVKFSNGNSIGEGEHAILTNIGIYSGATKLNAPTHMYHDATKLGPSAVIDFAAFYLRMSEIDNNVKNNTITVASFGLQGKSVFVRSSHGIKANLIIAGDIENNKNHVQTITVLAGMVQINIPNEKAAKNIVLVGGTGYNAFHSAKRMYGNATGSTNFFVGFPTEYVEGGAHHQADNFAIEEGYKLRKLAIFEHEVKLFTQDTPSRDTTVQTRNIHTYHVTAATQEVFLQTDHQFLSLLFVTRHVSTVFVKSGVHWYINITQIVPGVFVRLETLLGEVTVSSRGNTIVMDDPNIPSLWHSVLLQNGDFSQGTKFWDTDYKIGVGIGYVNVATTMPSGWNMGAVKGLNGVGHFLLVDGGPDPRQAFWRANLGTSLEGVAYRFSFWMTANDIHQAKVQFYVNGKQIQDFSMVSSQDGWSRQVYTFIPSANTPLVLELKDLETNWQYNDLAITNIALEATHLQGKVLPWTVTPPSLINGSLENYEGFSTQYQRGVGTILGGPGTADIVKKPPEWGLGIKGAHTGEYFLMADGKAGLNLWQEDIDGFKAGSFYRLYFYMATNVNPSVLQLHVNGQATGKTVTSSPGADWTKKTILFQAEKSGRLSLSLRDINDNPAGNDVALDTMSLVEELDEADLEKEIFGTQQPTPIIQLIKNPNFDEGFHGSFFTQYVMIEGSKKPQEGQATLVGETQELGDGSTMDGIGGAGLFLLAKAGKTSVDKILWEETVSVKDPADYLFTYYAASKQSDKSRPLLTVYANGKPVTPYQFPDDHGNWTQLSSIIPVSEAQAGQPLTITIKDSQAAQHWVALDKILFTKMPKPANLQPINLLKNGDFSDGFNGWGTDYVYGDYTGYGHAVVTKKGPDGWGLGDVTGPDGNSFLMVDGGFNAAQAVLRQTVDLVKGQYYKLAYELMGNDLNHAEIQVRVNGTKVGDGAYVYASEGWTRKEVLFQATASGPNFVEFFDEETRPMGNDFGLANLSLYSLTGPIVFNVRDNNQIDAYDARLDTEFYLRPPIKAPKPTPEQQAAIDQLPKSDTHSPTENLPWQALASAYTNNEFNMQMEDLFNLSRPAEIYLASVNAALQNKVDLGGVVADAAKVQSTIIPRYEKQDVFVSVTKTDIAHSTAIVGDHAFITNQYMYEVYVKGKEVLNIYSMAGRIPTLAIYVDQELIYHNAFWA